MITTGKKLFFAATILLCCATGARAQQVIQAAEKPYIEVTGTAEKEVVPDEIYISITLTERYEGRNKITIDDQERQLKDKVKALGIDLTNLSVSDADASYVKINWLNKDVISKKNYSLKVATADMAGKVFQSLEDMNIKDASISKTDYSKKEELRKELRISAIKTAKDKATYMLDAIGQMPGKPLRITVDENNTQPYMPMYKMANVAMAAPAPNGDNTSNDYLEFNKMKFTLSVTAAFEVK